MKLSEEKLNIEGEQACNASLSKDGSKRTAFLDFASATGREFVGESYAVHERLLVMDSTGALVASVAAPSDYSFDHTEWAIGRTSSTPNLLVATLVNTYGAHEKVALVDLSSGKVTEILKGEEIWHPCVWVKSTSVIDEDAGPALSGHCKFTLCRKSKRKKEYLCICLSMQLSDCRSLYLLHGISPQIENKRCCQKTFA